MRLKRYVTRFVKVVAIIGGALFLLTFLLGLAFFLIPGSARGAKSINHEPITLDQANQLIDNGQVYRIAIRQHNNIDEYFLRQGSPGYDLDSDRTPRWGVDGEDVHLFTESMPTGVPILSDDKDEVGLTSDQFESFLARIERYNATASSPIDVLDQRIYSRD